MPLREVQVTETIDQTRSDRLVGLTVGEDRQIFAAWVVTLPDGSTAQRSVPVGDAALANIEAQGWVDALLDLIAADTYPRTGATVQDATIDAVSAQWMAVTSIASDPTPVPLSEPPLPVSETPSV